MVIPKYYPDSATLVNKLGMQDSKTLQSREAALTIVRVDEYRNHLPQADFDLIHLQSIHQHIFQDLYNWAGELRSFDTRKGICEFTPAQDIHSECINLFTSLANDSYLENLNTRNFITQLARYYSLLNKIHPFPEGNGRCQRLFFEHLAWNAGYQLDWNKVYAWEIEETAINTFRYPGEEGRESIIALLERITHPSER